MSGAFDTSPEPMIYFPFRRVLVLAPHTDDAELGCGGLLARLLDEGADVREIAFSIARDSVPAGFPDDILATEVRAAARVLGIADGNVEVLDLPVRRLDEHRQTILDHLIGVRRAFGPDLVLVPASSDVHQDHQVVHREGLRAFRNTTMLGYDLPWNSITFSSSCLVELGEAHFQRKVEALAAYASQRHRAYVASSFVRSWAVTRGAQIGLPMAEAYELLRLVFPLVATP